MRSLNAHYSQSELKAEASKPREILPDSQISNDQSVKVAFVSLLHSIIRKPTLKSYNLKSLSQILLLIGFCAAYNWAFRQQSSQQQYYEELSEYASTASATSTAHAHRSSSSQLPISIRHLNPNLLPRSQASLDVNDLQRRLVFIGDIHGCIDELLNLLEAANFNEESDHIVVTGDIINKGPASHAVLDFLMKKRASCVRGNHDQHILNVRGAIGSEFNIATGLPSDAEIQLAQSLTTSQLSYLASCPMILRIGTIGTADYVVVHGGLVPSLPLEQQDPWSVMHMRTIDPLTLEPLEDHDKLDCVHWAELWNDYQRRVVNSEASPEDQYYSEGSRPMTVIYGHDARRGLQIKEFSKGLDTSCVKGKLLTALILDSAGEQSLHHVSCDKRRA